jgi:ATP-binding cassette subfamily B protein
MIEALRTLVPYMVRYRWRYAAGFTALVLTVLTSASIPALIGYTVDELNRSFSMELTVKLGGALLLAGLVKGVFQYWMRWVLIGISRDIEYDLRNDLFARLVVQSQRFFQTHRTGDLMSRATNDMNAVRLMLGPGVMYTADVTITFIILLGVMSSTDWRLTLAIFAPIPLVSFTVSFFGRRIHDRFQTVQEKFSDISSLVQENLSNVRIVRAYAQEEAEATRFRLINTEYIRENLRLIRLWGQFYPLLETMIGFSYVIVLWFGGRQVVTGAITLGDFVMFMTYTTMLTWPMIGIGWVVNIVQRGRASLGRLTELMNAPCAIADGAATDHTIAAVRGDIELKDVSFTYSGSERPALRQVSLYVPAGRTVAIIGPTGSGKTTLVNLVARLMDPQSGVVVIDGNDARRIPLQVLRQAIGFVPQESFLFSQTIQENISFGAPLAEPWEIAEAAGVAELHGDVEEFPEQYGTYVGERGITLSGGQKQRTAIARAIVRDPRILILDDALSSVDTITEERILTQLQSAMRNRTALMISHRVSAARHADVIVVLDKGRVVESGTHGELLELEGEYYELYQKQLLEEELETV